MIHWGLFYSKNRLKTDHPNGYKPLIICNKNQPKTDCALLWIKQPKKQAFIAILAPEKDYICQP
jgi:hypothetical protein